MGIVRHYVAKHHGDKVAHILITQGALISGAVPGVIDKMLPGRVALHDLQPLKHQVSPNLYVPQLVPAACQSLIQQIGEAQLTGIVYPIPAFYAPDGFLRGAQFALVKRRIFHTFPPVFVCFQYTIPLPP